MPIEYRPITEEEVQEAAQMDAVVFGYHLDDSQLPRAREWFGIGQSVAAFDGGNLVGLVVLYPLEMSIPGGSELAACIGNVGVLPTHRRRGIMTEMMRQQLTSAYETGLTTSPLTASEATIYGRFGYGIAAEHEKWTVERQHTAFRRDYQLGGSLEMVKGDYAKTVFLEIYRRAMEGRAGVIQPPKPWWDGMFSDRGAVTDSFYVEYRAHEVEGYVIYQIKGEAVIVRQLMAVTDAAYAALWRYCFDIDLPSKVKASHRPVDDPLIWMLADYRGLKLEVHDRTWLRLIDVPKALSSRTYAQEDTLVFEIHDDFCPWNQGTYELTGGPFGAECKPTTKIPDLVLTSADLAVPYMGGFPFTPLARAGRVEEQTPGAVARADAMFATQLKPWSPVLC